jgi:hypothetical protein
LKWKLKSKTLAVSQQNRKPLLSKSLIYFLTMGMLTFACSLSAQTQDNRAPVLTRITLSPDNIVLNAASQNELEVSLTLVFEDQSSVSTNDFFLQSLATQEQVPFTQVGDWQISGNKHTGLFTANLTTSSAGQSGAGIWHIDSLLVTDSNNNSSDAYDTFEDLLIARLNPFISTTEEASDVVFDSIIEASPTFTQTGDAQTSFVELLLQDAIEYDIWFVANPNTDFSNIVFSNAISITQACTTYIDYTRCKVTASNNNQAILASVETRAIVSNDFGYSVFAQPTGAANESQWLSNYIEFPRIDIDNDGIPNEQDLDDDNDTVPDLIDLFPFDPNESVDFDEDGVGDNADSDDDNDGVNDEQDAFPFDPAENNDNDNDGLGDVADNDDDNDGVIDSQDAFPFDPSESLDTDADGIGNNADNDDDNDGGTDDNDAFPLDPRETIDSDGDGIGNNADTDDDNDGVLDINDAFPRDPNESIDTDQDGIGNNTDPDDDNDGVLDVDDSFPLDAGDFRDNDQDGIGDNADSDDDNDNIPDIDDAFPFNPNESRDFDGDGIGNNADPDDDNDGLDDSQDQFPFDASEVADFDGDGIGNNADTDDDNDGVLDVVDAFVFAVTEWFDTDNDGIGDNADPDNDNDGVDDIFDAFENDPLETIDTDGDFIGNNSDTDDDNDGVLDLQDAFPLNALESLDTDFDGIGNNEDTDDDGDRVSDEFDLFPLDYTESVDTDADGIGNNRDLDDDNDGVLDIDDAFPLDDSETLDFDSDNIGDNTDPDDDNDGFDDSIDVFPFNQSEWADNDADGLGDNADLDDDNDGVIDTEDAFDFDATETLDNDNDGIGNNADLDDDNDGVLDTSDAFPFSAAESLDTDLDGIGNNADVDDDNDGIVDADDIAPLNPTVGDDEAPLLDGIVDLIIEASGPLTPVVLTQPRVRDNNLYPATLSNDYSGPLPLGEHRVTFTAVDFAGNQSTLVQKITIVDTTAPVFSSADTIVIASRGIFTDVNQDLNETATDLVDGVLGTKLLTENNLKSGSQSVILQATDASGNFAIKEFFIDILPTFTAKPKELTAAGSSLKLPVVLSGKAPAYPVSVEYTVEGPATSPVSGVLQITKGQMAELNIDVAPTASLGQQVWISFANPQNAAIGQLSQISIEVTNLDKAPISDIKLLQQSQVMGLAYQNQGNVTLAVNINDINLDDTHQIVWQLVAVDSSNSPLDIVDLNTDNDDSTFEFDPALLPAGGYIASAQISQSNTSELYTSQIQFAFSIKAAAPVLSAFTDSDFDGISDQLEGFSDSDLDGIPDYLDDNSNTAIMPTGVSEQPLTTLSGYRLTIGDIAKLSKAQNATNAVVSAFDIQTYGLSSTYPDVALDDPHFTAIQAIINVNIENLSTVGESVPLIVPLNTGTTIPTNASYRKFNSRDGWFTFVENAHNAILSAPFDANGNCPQADSNMYLSGLTQGDTCIALIIQDGGPNDGDLSANGLIKDPGVLSVRMPNNSPLINVAQQTTVFEGETVRVDASLTTDAEKDALLFKWTQIGGTRINLGELNSPLLSFNAPMVGSTEIMLFRLDVFDGRDTSSTTVQVKINNRNSVPTVTIEPHSSTLDESESITLQADANDIDGELLSFEWRQLSGPAVVFSSQNSQTLTFNAPQVSANEVIEIAVYVSDSEKQVSATTTINVINTASPIPADAGDSGGGGAMGIVMLAMGFLIACIRRIKGNVHSLA